MFNEDALFQQMFEAKQQRRESTYDCSTIDFGNVPDAIQRYVSAYGAFILSPEVQKNRGYHLDYNRSHKCSADCPRVVIGEFAFCVKSGNLHVCDTAHCDESQHSEDDGELVCTFTGKKYGKVLDLDMQDRAGSADQFSTEKMEKPKKVKVFGPKPKRVKQKRGIKGRKLADKTRQRQNDPNLLQMQAFSYLTQKLLKSCPEPIPEGLRERFGRICAAFWNRIYMLTEDVLRARKYTFELHCLVIAYKLKEGFSTQGQLLLPATGFLEKHLPSMKEFSKMGIDSGLHTCINKEFLYGFRQLRINNPPEFKKLVLEVRGLCGITT